MKKLFLLPMMVCLLLAGCQDPDDDVDMPEPQKPVSELIQGEWDGVPSYGSDSGHEQWNYSFDNGEFRAADANDPEEYSFGEYTLSESGGKNFIELVDNFESSAKYEITAISDSAMTWKLTDGGGPDTWQFTRK
ncbi:hypothetical protein I2I11_05830 [Pontibacter sp. 172403-2]|uniref:hypothetical protein n=1 Tax=Pontibacter rufus TaxID=2791028 RepID=UPI0018AFD5DE|nr:hypothetical protein [Pontibacter sp. 172403-2]MBF9252800.1 hypothetical protein [Pontibacter sp. 172403-2]